MTRSSRLPSLLALFVIALAWLPWAPAEAAPDEASTTQIHLITMGPGESLYARGGHAALMVAHMRGDAMIASEVYNYGDTDFNDPDIAWKFITGTLDFRLDHPGDMFDVAENYGLRQNRDVFTQTLALTDTQVQQIATHLETTLAPELRDYRYHYVEQICTTKIRDLLDEVLGGPIRQQLQGTPDAQTTRDYQRAAFNGHPLAGLGTDLVMGRSNDAPIDQYYSLFVPDHLRVRLQEVMVPDPAGSGTRVPLAGPPEPLAGHQGSPPPTGQTLGSWWLFVLVFAVLATMAYGITRTTTEGPRVRALGRWLLLWVVVCGACSLVIGGVMLITHVPQFIDNELILTFLPIDLWLVMPAIGFARGSARMLGPVRTYAFARLVVASAVIVFRLPGWMIQQPLAAPLFVLGGYAMLVYVLHRVSDEPAPAPKSPSE